MNDLIIAVTANGKLLGAGMVGSDPEPSHLNSYPFARFVQWFEYTDDVDYLERLPVSLFGRLRGSGLRILSLLEKKKIAA